MLLLLTKPVRRWVKPREDIAPPRPRTPQHARNDRLRRLADRQQKRGVTS